MKTILSLFATLLLIALPARTDAQAESAAPAGMGNVVIFRSGADSGRSYSLTYPTRPVRSNHFLNIPVTSRAAALVSNSSTL